MSFGAIGLWLDTVFAGFDLSITLLIHKLYELGGPFFTPFFDFISFLGHDGIPLIILSVLLMIPVRTRKYGTAMLAGLAIGALFTNLVLKVLIARARPYTHPDSIYYQFWQLVGSRTESDKSFPSGHATAAFASMVALFLIGRRSISWTALIFAFLMGVSRIYLCVHYPTDVFAGAIVGTVAGILGWYAAAKLIPSGYYRKKLIGRQNGVHRSPGGKHARH